MFEEGDLVDVGKGAKFWGVVIGIYSKLDNTPGCVVEAIDMGFRATTHVYPEGQLRLIERGYAYKVGGQWYMRNDDVGGADGRTTDVRGAARSQPIAGDEDPPRRA